MLHGRSSPEVFDHPVFMVGESRDDRSQRQIDLSDFVANALIDRECEILRADFRFSQTVVV